MDLDNINPNDVNRLRHYISAAAIDAVNGREPTIPEEPDPVEQAFLVAIATTNWARAELSRLAAEPDAPPPGKAQLRELERRLHETANLVDGTEDAVDHDLALDANDWAVIRLALETQERVMIERGAHPAAEAAHQLRARITP